MSTLFLLGIAGAVLLVILLTAVICTADRTFLRKEEAHVLTLNYRDSRPIYEQIKDGLRRMIVTGAMAQDEKLPSVRALATQLSINPNTIQRAYNELEAEGYIYSVAGKGSFVSGTADADAVRRETLRADVKKLLNELRYLGVTEADAAALIKEVYEQ